MPDSSLEIAIQRATPGPELESDSLPSPDAGFSLSYDSTLRGGPRSTAPRSPPTGSAALTAPSRTPARLRTRRGSDEETTMSSLFRTILSWRISRRSRPRIATPVVAAVTTFDEMVRLAPVPAGGKTGLRVAPGHTVAHEAAAGACGRRTPITALRLDEQAPHEEQQDRRSHCSRSHSRSVSVDDAIFQ